jgi:hypothetical protein
MRVGVGDDDVGALRADAADLGRRLLQLAEVVVALGAEHDHAVAERELGVGDAAGLVGDDEVALEPEGAAEPVDRRRRVAVAHRGNHRHLGLRAECFCHEDLLFTATLARSDRTVLEKSLRGLCGESEAIRLAAVIRANQSTRRIAGTWRKSRSTC